MIDPQMFDVTISRYLLLLISGFYRFPQICSNIEAVDGKNAVRKLKFPTLSVMFNYHEQIILQIFP